ncbi:DUF4337 family protein [Spongiimicrobium sp. 3-5]|uniref:DUF4337 family protein n=1 Tax=Spongiimicrobium sp. 3-5 TaxID=3332596 RepID=UPI00398021D2
MTDYKPLIRLLHPKRLKLISGVLIVLFAALMAIAEMVSSTLEENRLIAHNKHTSYTDWYQAKSIKQVLKENELNYLESILSTLSVTADPDPIKEKIKETKKLILKYNAEKTEILMGSANIPKDYWVQDLDGEMGKIVGLREWEVLTTGYERAVRKFGLGIVFFQICIVLGAVCLIITDSPKLQRGFIFSMICFGLIGVAIFGYGWTLAP